MLTSVISDYWITGLVPRFVIQHTTGIPDRFEDSPNTLDLFLPVYSFKL